MGYTGSSDECEEVVPKVMPQFEAKADRGASSRNDCCHEHAEESCPFFRTQRSSRLEELASKDHQEEVAYASDV